MHQIHQQAPRLGCSQPSGGFAVMRLGRRAAAAG
jgi:hypothetical protein